MSHTRIVHQHTNLLILFNFLFDRVSAGAIDDLSDFGAPLDRLVVERLTDQQAQDSTARPRRAAR
jgi:hypothetical protein